MVRFVLGQALCFLTFYVISFTEPENVTEKPIKKLQSPQDPLVPVAAVQAEKEASTSNGNRIYINL